MAYLSGKHAFLQILRQEGASGVQVRPMPEALQGRRAALNPGAA